MKRLILYVPSSLLGYDEKFSVKTEVDKSGFTIYHPYEDHNTVVEWVSHPTTTAEENILLLSRQLMLLQMAKMASKQSPCEHHISDLVMRTVTTLSNIDKLDPNIFTWPSHLSLSIFRKPEEMTLPDKHS